MARFHEFFAGAGLVRLGLAGDWTCVWANDIDPRKAEVYARNFGADELVVGDVCEVRADDLPPGVEMAWASFPCQDLSLAGWRRGMAGRRSGTFWAFWRLMRELHDRGQAPPIIVLENVMGLLHSEDYAGLCEALAALGMRFGALVGDARWFLPQSRPRVFVVAVDARADLSGLAEGGPSEAPWFPAALTNARARLPKDLAPQSTWWRLPDPGLCSTRFGDLMLHEARDMEWHSPEETERLLGMMTDRNLAKVHEARRRGGAVGLLYRRTRGGKQRAEARFDGIAGCLRTPEGGSSRQTVLVVEPDRVRSRLLHPREAARLMGAPDSYWLPPHYNNAYRAMGDGVAVPVVRWLSDSLLRPLCERVAELRGRERAAPAAALLRSRRAADARAEGWRLGLPAPSASVIGT